MSSPKARSDERVIGSDAAVAVGRFNPDGPSGYRARSNPAAPVRDTRAEAEDDQRAFLAGLELGLERAGMQVVGQVELDDYCRRVLAKHWPDVPRHDDVRTAADWWLSEERPTVDVICGGFPCQDISVAGRRAGIIDGERSSLWAYLAHTVRVLRPRYVLVENVSALLVRGLDVVAADLAEIGYDLRWDCVPAAALGAPHRRDRWFGIAYPNSQQLRVEPVIGVGGGGQGITGHDGAARFVADSDCEGLEGRRIQGAVTERSTRARELPHAAGIGRGQGGAGRSPSGRAYWQAVWPQALADSERLAGQTEQSRGVLAEPPPRRGIDGTVRRGGPIWEHWATEPDVGRVADGVPARMDRLRALGNAVVPQVSEHIGRIIVAHAASVQVDEFDPSKVGGVGDGVRVRCPVAADQFSANRDERVTDRGFNLAERAVSGGGGEHGESCHATQPGQPAQEVNSRPKVSSDRTVA